MPDYRVTYEIDVVADRPTAAARMAWDLICGQQTDPNALPPVLRVRRTDVRQAKSRLIELKHQRRSRRPPNSHPPGA